MERMMTLSRVLAPDDGRVPTPTGPSVAPSVAASIASSVTPPAMHQDASALTALPWRAMAEHSGTRQHSAVLHHDRLTRIDRVRQQTPLAPGRPSWSERQLSRPLTWCIASVVLWAMLALPAIADDESEPVTVAQIVAEMNERISASMRGQSGNGPLRRFNQAKTIGCAYGRFETRDDVPAALAHGVFRPGQTFPAYVRFANARELDDSKKDIRGLSIRLSDVPGEVLDGIPGHQDFLLNSYPGLFVATPEEFLEFIRAEQNDRLWQFFLDPRAPRLAAAWTAFRSRQHHEDPLEVDYYSTVPYRVGRGEAAELVKYVVRACESGPEVSVDDGPDRLRAALRSRLSESGACLSFGVQPRVDPERMPIEDARTIWSERDAPVVEVARIELEAQTIDDPVTLAACEASHFDPWQSLVDHEPVGRMNLVRRGIYKPAAALRDQPR